MPTSYKSGMVAHTYDPSTGLSAQEDQEFKVILDYILSLRPPWATEDSVWKEKKKKKNQQSLSNKGLALSPNNSSELTTS